MAARIVYLVYAVLAVWAISVDARLKCGCGCERELTASEEKEVLAISTFKDGILQPSPECHCRVCRGKRQGGEKHSLVKSLHINPVSGLRNPVSLLNHIEKVIGDRGIYNSLYHTGKYSQENDRAKDKSFGFRKRFMLRDKVPVNVDLSVKGQHKNLYEKEQILLERRKLPSIMEEVEIL